LAEAVVVALVAVAAAAPAAAALQADGEHGNQAGQHKALATETKKRGS
jgi:hypothetical protein